jgi:hypothetical protein
LIDRQRRKRGNGFSRVADRRYGHDHSSRAKQRQDPALRRQPSHPLTNDDLHDLSRLNRRRQRACDQRQTRDLIGR